MATRPPRSEGGNRDVIVVGASMGGVEAIRQLLQGLPGDLPAALFVVQHTADHGPGLLAQVLGKSSRLPVVTAAEGQRFDRGRVYVAPPDLHLIVGHDHVHVRRGPRENASRPAIDPLFRSAAASCTTRVIGVVLTGTLNDGTSGLQAIKRCGGLAVVQDPRDAAYGEMPRSAVRQVAVDHVLPLHEIPAILAALSRQARPLPPEVPDEIRAEALIAAQDISDMRQLEEGRTIAPITCPECHGSMHEIVEGELVRYRCHTGHAFTLEALGAIQADAWERALYSAYRAQQERAILLNHMAEDARAKGAETAAEQLQRRAQSYEEGADLLRDLLARGNLSGSATEDSETQARGPTPA
jgi:two-component system, chemotaxis family, protein-glutamate methylesterase/glutaminase